MHIFDLGESDGTWEAVVISTDRRRLGFCSIIVPQVGDLVSINRISHKVLYQIESVNLDSVPRYPEVPEYKFWTGSMVDLISTKGVTTAIHDALRARGLTT